MQQASLHISQLDNADLLVLMKKKKNYPWVNMPFEDHVIYVHTQRISAVKAISITAVQQHSFVSTDSTYSHPIFAIYSSAFK